MTRIVSWIDSCISTSKGAYSSHDVNRIDNLQHEAMKQLKEGREFMISAIESISSKYRNEEKPG